MQSRGETHASWWTAAAVASALLAPTGAWGTIDLTGGWVMQIAQFQGISFPFRRRQRGTGLPATLTPDTTGQIDPMTGAFTLTGTYQTPPPEPGPPVTCSFVIAATAAPDGNSFTGRDDDTCGIHSNVGG